MPRGQSRDRDDDGAAPAAVEPFERALGADGAIALFLTFGGSVLYLSERPRVGARLLDVVGLDGVRALFREFGTGHVNVPLANGWIARRLAGQGVARAEIARRLRVSRERLRGLLADDTRGAGEARETSGAVR